MTQEKINRKKRVARLKKMILGTMAFFILLPTVLCGVLFAKVHGLQVRLDQIVQMRQQMAAEAAAGYGGGMDEALANESLDDHELKEGQLAANQVTPDSEVYDGPRVYLTFDDGPSSNTDAILDVLAAHDVKATFFVVMQTDEKSIARYNRILEEGHTLAMHSASHVYSQVYASMESYISDVTTLQDYIESVTGYKPTIYRFPGGSSNTVSDVPIADCIDYLEEQGITYFDWNVASGDADKVTVASSTITSNVIKGITGKDMSVVLLHDAAAKKNTVEALDSILTYCEENGYNVLPITDGTESLHHRLS